MKPVPLSVTRWTVWKALFRLLIIKIASSPKAEIFEYVTAKLSIRPILTARIVFEKTTEWKRAGLNIENITSDNWKEYFKYVADYPALTEVVDKIFTNLLSGDKSELKDEINYYITEKNTEIELKSFINEAFNSDVNRNMSEEMIHKQYMGNVMQKVRGKIQGKIISDKIWTEMKKQEA